MNSASRTPDGGAEQFWLSFVDSSARLRELITAGRLDDAFDRIESLLARSGYDLICEITQEDDDAVLILTPEGDPKQASEIDSLLGRRPTIAGWRFYGRRQRKPVQDAFVFVRHIFGVDVRDARFLIERDRAKWKVTMYSQALTSMEPDERNGVVRTFLWHALGEDLVMSRISSVHSLVAAGSRVGLLEPGELVQRLADA